MSKTTQTKTPTKIPPAPQKKPPSETARNQKAINQRIVASPKIKLEDKRGWGNLGDNAYTITPMLTATLGDTFGKLNNVNLDIGDSLANNGNAATKIVSVQTEQSPATASYPYTKITHIAKYHSKNVHGWSGGKVKIGVGYKNLEEVTKSINPGAKSGVTVPVKGVPIEISGGAGIDYKNQGQREVDASYANEFNIGGKNEYFSHQHTVVLTVDSSGYAQSQVTSEAEGNKVMNEVNWITDFTGDKRYDPQTQNVVPTQPDKVRTKVAPLKK